MSNTMGGMGKYFHSLEKDIEYYRSRLHQADKQVEVSNIYDFSVTYYPSKWRSKPLEE